MHSLTHEHARTHAHINTHAHTRTHQDRALIRGDESRSMHASHAARYCPRKPNIYITHTHTHTHTYTHSALVNLLYTATKRNTFENVSLLAMNLVSFDTFALIASTSSPACWCGPDRNSQNSVPQYIYYYKATKRTTFQKGFEPDRNSQNSMP